MATSINKVKLIILMSARKEISPGRIARSGDLPLSSVNRVRRFLERACFNLPTIIFPIRFSGGLLAAILARFIFEPVWSRRERSAR